MKLIGENMRASIHIRNASDSVMPFLNNYPEVLFDPKELTVSIFKYVKRTEIPIMITHSSMVFEAFHSACLKYGFVPEVVLNGKIVDSEEIYEYFLQGYKVLDEISSGRANEDNQ